MGRILIIYGTKYGQTEKIAAYLEAELTDLGHMTLLFDSECVPSAIRPQDFDQVILGGGVFAGRYPRPLRRWVRAHSKELEGTPSAFFSVCLSILQQSQEAKQDAHLTVTRFFDSVFWHPSRWAVFPGALNYTRYGWLLKRVMRSNARRNGGDTNTSRDFEYTDWNEVKQFARQISDQLDAAGETVKVS